MNTLTLAVRVEREARNALDRLRMYGPREFAKRQARDMGMWCVWRLPRSVIAACVIRAGVEHTMPHEVVTSVPYVEILRRVYEC